MAANTSHDRLAFYVADINGATDARNCEIDPARQLEYDVVVYLDILPAARIRFLYALYHETVSRLFDLNLVILEVGTSARRTNYLDLRSRGIRVDDFDWSTNARDLNLRSRRELIGAINFFALLEAAAGFGSNFHARRAAGQHHDARKQCCNNHVLHLYFASFLVSCPGLITHPLLSSTTCTRVGSPAHSCN